uniref:Mitochondrial inner membrane protein OXA1 isoform X1 n=1 Tax=Rhizophora mucronata TaxID=61149 RepID=A0A2P2KI69_RHIMU
MAYIRSLATRSNLFNRRCRPSFSYVPHDDDQKELNSFTDEGPSQRQGISNYVQHRSFGTGFNTSARHNAPFQDRIYSYFSFSRGAGASFLRYMSTTSPTDKIVVADALTNTADVLADTSVQVVVNQVPAANEVAIAAADSFFPIAALQHLIDAVHSVTGLNWWVAIVLTTLLIRGATIPLLIYQLKVSAKLAIIMPYLDAINQKMRHRGMNLAAMAEGRKEIKKLYKKHGVSPLSSLKGRIIEGPIFISFFLAISNMVQKVPSFKTGGALWFIDLTTPDNLYVFPLLSALSFWLTVELHTNEGMEGNRASGTMKNVSRFLAAVSFPVTMNFPKALFCYWITSSLFSLSSGLALKSPKVKKFLGVPEIPVPPPTAAPKFSLNVFAALKQAIQARQEPTLPLPVGSQKPGNQKTSSSSGINQRPRGLEKQVKGRKKNKKR